MFAGLQRMPASKNGIRAGQVREYNQNGFRCKYFILSWDPDALGAGTVIVLESSMEQLGKFIVGTQEQVSCDVMFFTTSWEVAL